MMPNYNAILILEAIAAAPIPDDIKLQAVKDIRRMYEDSNYMKDDVSYFDVLEKPDLSGHHVFESSDLGADFWWKMDEIIRP